MNSAIYNALCACLGYSPNTREAHSRVREMYNDPENAPQFPRVYDVVFFDFSPDPGADVIPAAYGSQNPNQGTHVPAVNSFSAYTLLVVCYGPTAEENAKKIRAFLYLDGSGFPRSILRKAGLYPVPDPPEPLVLHEPEGSLWRLRADLTIRFRTEETYVNTTRRNAVTFPPAVTIHQ